MSGDAARRSAYATPSLHRSGCWRGAMRLRGVILTRMSNEWFARPVLFVADIDTAVEFYVKQLGFTPAWRYEEEGKARVAQVDRQGCQLILTSQWPDKVGKGLIFVSLDGAVLDALRAELEGRGVAVKDGEWGYRLMVVADADGNQLYFPYPSGPYPSRG
jgi:catechol 2,3-dioxygenase-like lactoylglutathione lyase family enzyme